MSDESKVTGPPLEVIDYWRLGDDAWVLVRKGGLYLMASASDKPGWATAARALQPGIESVLAARLAHHLLSTSKSYAPCFECGTEIADIDDPRVTVVSGEPLCPACAPHEDCVGDGCEECDWTGRAAEVRP